MIVDLLRRIFQPHTPTPPPPDVRMSSLSERNEIEERKAQIRARMQRLQLEAEQKALRRIHGQQR